MSELDLEKGDPARAEQIASRTVESGSTGKMGNQARKSSSRPTARDKAKVAADSEVNARLQRLFDRLADLRETQGDDELADAIRETKGEMTQGFVSLTRNVSFLRSPLLLFLGLVEPVLAFWKVGGILFRRWYERRVMSAEEAQRIHEQNAQFAAERPAPAQG